MNIIPDDAIDILSTGNQRRVDCEQCSHWFFGCLYGRKKWKDKSTHPKIHSIGETRMRCDAFEWIPEQRSYRVSGGKEMTNEYNKQITCPECGTKFIVHLLLNERGLLDGFHGECSAPFCGYRYFEELTDPSQVVPDGK